jgi:hypothetical protein
LSLASDWKAHFALMEDPKKQSTVPDTNGT